MRKLVTLLVIVLLMSCTNREEVVEQTFPNGNQKIVMVYEGSGDERVVIEQKSFYIGGQAEVVGKFDETSKRVGNWIYYYQNGNKWSECEYTTGVRNGKSITYYENGNKRYEGNYISEKQTGHWVFYKEDGTVQDEKDY
ncbi:MAG: hypothetical protein JKY42_09510 [Flavobacteriales bacterium]|nr:hypothetical protein [Flavobacteriales bacterium]